MGLMRESFIFYRSFYESIRELPPELQVEVIHAISEFALYGNQVEMSPVCKALFTAFCPSIQTAKNRYDACVENGKKGAGYGSLGGRPKTPKKTPKDSETETPDKTPEITGYKPLTDTVTVTDTVTDTVISAAADIPRAGAGSGGGYGVHNNVFLDSGAYTRIRDKLGEKDTERYIDILSGWLKSGKHVRDNASAILKWHSEDTAKAAAAKGDSKFVSRKLSQKELDDLFERLDTEEL